MAETANIAKMADKLSSDLFSEFFWEKVGPTNQNWTCEDTEKHKVGTHPSDVVFYYDEPYSQTRTYVNCDLKSYSSSSISSTEIKKAIVSLANQVACANKSEEWAKLYAHEHVNFDVCGLLFVYNHDGEYDKNFQPLLEAIRAQDLDLPPKAKLVVLGPQDIFWLDNVRYEICLMRGKRSVGNRKDCSYFYPQMETKRNVQLQKAKAATLEILTAPWTVLRYIEPKDPSRQGFVIFYRGKGESVQELLYLLDFLRHFQVFNEQAHIFIKTVQPDPNAPANFQKAVQQYNEEIVEKQEDIDNPLAELIRRIDYSEVSQMVSSVFSSIQIGMDYE